MLSWARQRTELDCLEDEQRHEQTPWLELPTSTLKLIRKFAEKVTLSGYSMLKDPIEGFDYSDPRCNPLLRPAAARTPSNHCTPARFLFPDLVYQLGSILLVKSHCVFACSLGPFRHLIQTIDKHTFLSLVEVQSSTSEYISTSLGYNTRSDSVFPSTEIL
ncbi:hypothetical protein F511_41025 [Dorcoceras hygrometricum]|uniref:Uncharacterized protein n=1 Tax=Dorcoceras hygrometricum TaxID=472368 RepID=A0A2Z7AGH8_9LAMI|nr:hypothetical protein F511_41025 [Dorcoceras hygrometricum]